MADKTEIAKSLRLIVLGKDIIENIIMCKVVSVDGTTCVCQPLDEGLSEILDVRLVAEEDDTNFIITPLVDSVVGVLAFSDLPGTDYYVAMFSKVDTINIRGDQYDGLVKSAELTSKLNTVEGDLNDLKQAFLSWVVSPNDGGAALKAASATWAGTPITETQQSDIENENVKHG